MNNSPLRSIFGAVIAAAIMAVGTFTATTANIVALTATGEVTAPYLVHVSKVSITNSTSTQNLAYFRFTTSSVTILDSYAVFATTTGVGSATQQITITLAPINSATGVTPGTDLLYDGFPAFSSVSSTMTPTSTLADPDYGKRRAQKNDYVTLRIASPTSSGAISGYLYVEWAE